jgi:hypothetical protein
MFTRFKITSLRLRCLKYFSRDSISNQSKFGRISEKEDFFSPKGILKPTPKKSKSTTTSDEEVIIRSAPIKHNTVASKIKTLGMKGLAFRTPDEEDRARSNRLKKPEPEEDEFKQIFIKQNEITDDTEPELERGTRMKWLRFFTDVQSRLIPNTNLAIKNGISPEVEEFFWDMRKNMNDKQVIFYLKNFLLNSKGQILYSYNEVIREVATKLIQQRTATVDVFDKNSLMLCIELLRLLPDNPYNPAFKPHDDDENFLFDTRNDLIRKIDPGLKLHSKYFTLEEYVFVLSTLLEKGYYDLYLVKNFFERFPGEELIITLDGFKHPIMYFGNRIDLTTAVLTIADKYIRFSEFTRDSVFPLFSDFVEKLIIKVRMLI